MSESLARLEEAISLVNMKARNIRLSERKAVPARCSNAAGLLTMEP
jgi:hypothetical protein